MQARDTMKTYHLLAPGDAVLAAFSGGADSTALLHLLCALREEWGLRVFAAHLNHGLRGEEADRDEAFVRARCVEWGVPCFVRRTDVRAEAARTGESEELCGRRLRYAFFAEQAEALGAKIATAHTLSDSVETMLLNLARGTGLAGLRGIPPVRGNIVRPLIETTRAEVEVYCAAHGLNYVTDSTNFSRAYGRNRIRLDVVPALRALNPALERTLARDMRLFARDEAVLEDLTASLLRAAAVPGGFAAEVLRASPLCARALAAAAAQTTGLRPEAVHVRAMEQLLRTGAGRTQLRGGWFAEIVRGVLSFSPGKEEPPAPFCRPLAPGVLENGPVRLKVTPVEHANVKKFESFCARYFKSVLDCDKIIGKAVIRTRRAGDFYHPAGRGVGKSLKKLFNEQAVPPSLRPYVPVAADETGIIWVGGFGPDARCAPDTGTRRVLFLAYDADTRKGATGDGGY
ncbi:tRNA lysidine(34) synthetase TilS [Ethanoligenens harbinense]|uniref:tRNA(Ile)-lysidine synthase n=1 Tax=Ethanoligenens harbinense (strain DSM 18485 / JCM 12961 / CGMCC 1.5033 / YUAN-3) TaxID=663278 RepID=E6U4R0_ETHHY|nr:tRNA lysidine(34) synthetase TilS [Ethanoligenens harbinense]ADU27795.1 tRNA(Ile)-lysidine synthetase [Ethanoligenens harbinense YUAN-3]AVQ96818.1 tRNA lysidine(34) synthetase TilS [Ethanoligenens harbinense YUAN-3]AYF39480.1 tRNA lysidine(34) synthetase TilS [Ethanoligenens harbinense]AYF42305.1 tRNA lysidine(34) synthetase TilS [Ethanoligenens harbinense]QCN93059.1 tRNA lysidine(34) synthetase TilS [Ethanoligenens harbinense]